MRTYHWQECITPSEKRRTIGSDNTSKRINHRIWEQHVITYIGQQIPDIISVKPCCVCQETTPGSHIDSLADKGREREVTGQRPLRPEDAPDAGGHFDRDL